MQRAQILLWSGEGKQDKEIVASVRERCVKEKRLDDLPRLGSKPMLDAKQVSLLIALACSDAPEGRDEWTLQVLADKLVELKVVERISDETVRRTLKKQAQTVAKRAVVHPAGRFRIRLAGNESDGAAHQTGLCLHRAPCRRCIFSHAETIRVVLDKLNTHSPASLYEVFPPEEVRRLVSKLEFHYTPKHASWLNMAEIEFSVMVSQCLKQRMPDQATLMTALATYTHQCNDANTTVRCQFDVQQARTMLGRFYPQF